MFKPLRSTAVIIGVLLVFGASVASAMHAWVYFGYELHWRGENKGPINLEVVDLTGDSSFDWNAYVLEASNDWTKSKQLNTSYNLSKRPVIQVIGGDEDPDAPCAARSDCIFVFADAYGPTGWLGLGGGWIEYDAENDQLHWILGVAYMNDFYFDNIPFYNTPVWRQLVMCQEIGHALGLTHNDEDFYNPPTGTCMDYSIDPTPNEHPDAHDYDVLDDIHAHRHDFSAPAAPPSIIPPGLLDGQFGELMSSSGASSVYVRDMGSNRYFITHVTWAQEDLGN